MKLELKCQDCGMLWTVPETDKEGNEYNGDDLYNCPNCKGKNFGEY